MTLWTTYARSLFPKERNRSRARTHLSLSLSSFFFFVKEVSTT